MAVGEHPNIVLIKSLYEVLEQRDMEAIGRRFVAEPFAHVGGNNALSGMRRGISQVLSLYETMLEWATNELTLHIHDILANDHHGLAILRVRCRRDGLTYDEYETHVYELEEDKIAGLFVYWNDPAPADRYFST